MLSALLLVLAQGGAWSGGRPRECTGGVVAGGNVWERAKSPELRRHCDLLASAASKLAGTGGAVEVALEAAREADRVVPGYAAPRALEGRALARLGKLDAAAEAFGEARTLDARALDEPPALLDWARLLARVGRLDESAVAYRALLPRASALPALERSLASVEAGLVLMSRGPSALDDAAAALREAARSGQDDGATLAVLGLALALDRGGDAVQAAALLSDRRPGDPRFVLSSPAGRDVEGIASAETHAIVAMGLERVDAGAARQAWDAYLVDAPGGPWAAHARAHRAALIARTGRVRR